MEFDAAARGRDRLCDWDDGRPRNFFQADPNFQAVLLQHLGPARFTGELELLARFGEQSATLIERAARETNRPEHRPRLRRYDAVGRRTEGVVFHPDHHEIGRRVYATGVMSRYREPGNERAQLAIEYLLSQNGEAGHACPLACTAGLIKLLQAVGSSELRGRFLPALFEADYDRHAIAAQFLSEVQGGSDVGANAVRAIPVAEGCFRLHGEKWFCSVIDADLFLMTARPEGAAEGTAGLGAFVVPRRLDDGTPNGFRIRRLKDKLGTRSMASAEVDFEGALGWPIGPLEQGFKNIVEIVLTTSRIYNAVCCAGFMRRAELEAFAFAHSRTAFGKTIAEFTAVQETLARIKVEAQAALASTYEIIAMTDRAALEGLSGIDALALRALIVMNKYVTSLRNTQVLHEAMELLGGNGAIEEFSVLPRLYRDAYVLEAWEGTHNVLAAQLLRDFQRYRIHEGLIVWMREKLEGVETDATRTSAALLSEAVERACRSIETLLAADGPTASLMSRDLSERLMTVAQGLCLLAESRWAERHSPGSDKAVVTEQFVRTRVARQDLQQDRGRLGRLQQLTRRDS